MYIDFFTAKPYHFKQFVGFQDEKPECIVPQTQKNILLLGDITVMHNPFWNETELCLHYQLNSHAGRAIVKLPENIIVDYAELAYRLPKQARASIEEFLDCEGLVFLQDRIESYINSVFAKNGAYK